MSENTPANPLAVELETFKRLLPSLLDHRGKFAVIAGADLLGTFSTWEDACKMGYQRVGTKKPFLVKRIEEVETINYFTRHLGGQCPISA